IAPESSLTADLCTVENSANPFGTVAAPPVSITGMCSLDQVASVNVEHFAASFRTSELARAWRRSKIRANRLAEGRFSVQKKRVGGTVESLSLTY
ncbi:MAG TPA: hypothetical protein VFQ41_20090, partial [Candidatus Angelobacter sp.]|nr:hypothetical protein [Candidatus Angelobacter sp.]